MTDKPYAQLERGTLLVASPDVGQGLYHRSVVLVCEHTPTGSFGLILNKPYTDHLPEDLSAIEEITHPKVGLRVGGSMQSNQMMLLHSSNRHADQTLKITDSTYLGGDITFLRECLESDDCPHLLLCFGYTGWITGELEKEFMSGAWFLHPSSPALIFNTPAPSLWQTCLREMGGKYTSLSMIPDDLTLN